MNKVLYLCILTIALSTFVTSCSKEPDVENTSTVKMSGDWWVQTFENGDADPVADFTRVMTYNTSDPNSNQVWFDDLENIWPAKGKLDIDYSTLSFKAKSGIENIYDTGETIDVIEGKVIPKGGHSKTGVVVDSIYLKVKFSDDPDNTYEFKGHQRTGFFEDEY